MNERKFGILLSYILIGTHAIIGFLYVPILLHCIGKSEYGLYQLIGSLIAYFSIMDFGLSGAIVRFYSKYLTLNDTFSMENVLAGAMRLYGGIALLLLICGSICYHFLDFIFGHSMSIVELVSAKELFLLLLFNLTISLVTMPFSAVINAYERFLFLKGTELIQLILQPILVVLILQKYPYAFSVALVQTILNCILIAMRVYYCFGRLHIRMRFHGWDKELFGGFRKLAISIFTVSLIDQVFFKTNQIILGIISGTEAVAVYSIASLIYMNYMSLSTAISGVYLPHVTAMVARKVPKRDISALFIQIGRWQYFLLLLVTTGFIIFGQQFILVWAGEDFLPAYWMTLLIIIPFTIDLIQNIGLSILQALNQYDFRAKVYIGMGVLNLLIAIPLAFKYDGIGCAFATGLSMLIGNGLLMNWYYAQKLGLSISLFWRQIGRITAIGMVYLYCGWIVHKEFSNTSMFSFIVEIMIYSLGYVGVMWRFAMNSNEKDICRKILIGGAQVTCPNKYRYEVFSSPAFSYMPLALPFNQTRFALRMQSL